MWRSEEGGPGAGGAAFPAPSPARTRCPPAAAGRVRSTVTRPQRRRLAKKSFLFFFYPHPTPQRERRFLEFPPLFQLPAAAPLPHSRGAGSAGRRPGPLAPELFTGPADPPSLFQLPEPVSIIKLFFNCRVETSFRGLSKGEGADRKSVV